MSRAHPSVGPARLSLTQVLAAAALAAVFLSYLDPHLTVDLANRVWACF